MAMRKVTVEVNEEQYTRLEHLAREAGMQSVEEYVKYIFVGEAEWTISFEQLDLSEALVNSLVEAKVEADQVGWKSETDVRNRFAGGSGDWQEKSAG